MPNRWKGVLIRFDERELETIDRFCHENNVKRTDFIRNAARRVMNNPDSVDGIVKCRNDGVDVIPLMDGITMLTQKVENVEKGISSLLEGNKFSDATAKNRIIELILKIKQKAKNVTTVDKLREQIKRMDPSFEQFLFASAANGIPPFDDALIELQQRGELSRDIRTGIVKWNGG
jgi:hypothetical protein